jgi:hypothetical protein
MLNNNLLFQVRLKPYGTVIETVCFTFYFYGTGANTGKNELIRDQHTKLSTSRNDDATIFLQTASSSNDAAKLGCFMKVFGLITVTSRTSCCKFRPRTYCSHTLRLLTFTVQTLTPLHSISVPPNP